MMDRRKYQREYARRQREAKLNAARQSRSTCPKGRGPGICGGALYSVTDGNGTARVVCDRCERQRRGICQDCPLPVEGRVGKALRCAKHKADAVRQQLRRYTERNRKTVNLRARQSYQTDAEVRQRRNEYKRLWRKANRDKVKAQKRRYALRGKMAEAMRKMREAGHVRRETPRVEGLRVCLTPGCDRVLTHRAKKCSHCKEREARQASALLASRRRAA